MKQLLSKKIGYSIFGLIGFLCAFLWKAEKDLAVQGNILWTGSYLLKILAFSLVVGVLVGAAICFLIYGAAEGGWFKQKQTMQTSSVKAWKMFGGSLVLTLLSYLPCYLAYYPGICSYDTTIQLGQIAEGAYIDHHPLAHTLLLKGFMQLGNLLLGSANTGIGIYVAVQMLFLASAFAYGMTQLYRYQVKRGWLILLQIYCMIYPFHWYMSVTTVKDTVFSAFFFLQMISFYVLLTEGQGLKLFNIHSVLFMLSTVGMILFRNNGKYAMLVLLFFLLLAIWRGKKQRKLWCRLFAYALVGFVIGNLVMSALFTATNAEQGDRREMLSMPIQQLARCMIYHGGVGVITEDDNTMTDEAKAFINDFLLHESYKEYRPDISDPVKSHTNTYVVRYRIKDFVSTYLKLLAEYPGDYINAVLAVNAGYLSPSDESHAFINLNGRDTGLGYIQTRWLEEELRLRGIYKDSMWETLHASLEEWADGNSYLEIPILKYIFVPGTYLWLYLIFAGYLLIHKKYRMLLPLSLVLGYYITLILGPTVQLRYIYPVMIILPFMIKFSKK